MFAISSAIPPVESLGVRHAASGSAATSPAGTIKLHLNNVSVRAGGETRGAEEGREKGEKRRRGERSELHRYRKRLGQNVGGERRLRRGDLAEDVIALTTTAEKGGRFERSGLNK